MLNHHIIFLLFLMLVDLTQLVGMRRYLKSLAADAFLKDTACSGTQTFHLKSLVATAAAPAVDLFFLILLIYYLVPSEDLGIFQIEFVSRETKVDFFSLLIILPRAV